MILKQAFVLDVQEPTRKKRFGKILKQQLSDSVINNAFEVVRMGFNKIEAVRSSDELTGKNFILNKISSTLLLADHDHKNRESLYFQLAKKLFFLTDSEDTDAEDTNTEDIDTEKTETKDKTKQSEQDPKALSK